MSNCELVVVSDTHVANVWNTINKALPSKYYFLNSNHYLTKLVKSLRKNQKLVINGDIVDYYYSDYSAKNPTNWDLFFDILSKCKCKFYFNLGNHEYRSHAYNFSIYGLRHVNISDKIRKRFLKKIKFDKFRGLNELKSVLLNIRKFNPLRKYPFKEFYNKSFNGYELIFLNTGPDIFTKFPNLLNPKNWLALYGDNIKSLGISLEGINFLKRTIKKSRNKDIIVFLHCPPFFAKNKISPIRIDGDNYNNVIKKHNLDYGIFISNNWEFISTLLSSNKNLLIITSHTDMPKQYVIEKKTQILMESNIKEINRLRTNQNYIKFVSTLPLCSVSPYNKKIGSLVINSKIEYSIIDDFSNKYLIED